VLLLLAKQEKMKTPSLGNDREFDLAISFAGEDRTIAEQIATQLEDRGFRVFYDEFFRDTLWGKNLQEYLGEVYEKRSRLCLIIVSKHYVGKTWPTHEKRHALARQLRESQEYVLLLRLDDTEVPGYPGTFGYLRFSSVDETVAILEKKLRKPRLAVDPAKKESMKRELQSLARELLHLEGVILTTGYDVGYSPDDDPEDDERGELDELRERYASLLKSFKLKCGERYDPYGELSR
jgi:hypothetical protein